MVLVVVQGMSLFCYFEQNPLNSLEHKLLVHTIDLCVGKLCLLSPFLPSALVHIVKADLLQSPVSIVCSATLVLPNCCEKRSLNSYKTGVKLGWTSLGMSSMVELWSLHVVGIYGDQVALYGFYWQQLQPLHWILSSVECSLFEI